jgi:hypothetical protein
MCAGEYGEMTGGDREIMLDGKYALNEGWIVVEFGREQ